MSSKVRSTNEKLAYGAYALVSKSSNGKNLTLKQTMNKALQIAQAMHSVGKYKGKAPTKNQMLNAALRYELKQ